MQPLSAGAVTHGFLPLLEATDDNRGTGCKAQMTCLGEHADASLCEGRVGVSLEAWVEQPADPRLPERGVHHGSVRASGRGELAQFAHDAGEDFEHLVQLRFGVETAERKSEAAPRPLVRQVHRTQDVRGLDGAGGAG